MAALAIHSLEGDPLAGSDRGGWPPELEEGKGTEVAGEARPQVQWKAVAVGQLAAVRAVQRAWRDGVVGVGVHGVPPEGVGHGEGRIATARFIPQLLPLDQAIRLAPEEHFAKVAKIPAIGDDAVARRQPSGQVGRLDRTGHRRKDGPDRRAVRQQRR